MDNTKWMTELEAGEYIGGMSAMSKSPTDIVDSESGEVWVEAGQPYGESRLHPDHDASGGSESPEEADPFNVADRAFMDAVEVFVADSDVVDDGDVPDLAEGFFSAYPQWQQWAQALDLSRRDVKEVVQDALAELIH